MGNGVVVLAPFVGLGNGRGFAGAEPVAVFFKKNFEEVADGTEFGGRQQIDESVGLLPFLLEVGFHGLLPFPTVGNGLPAKPAFVAAEPQAVATDNQGGGDITDHLLHNCQRITGPNYLVLAGYRGL